VKIYLIAILSIILSVFIKKYEPQINVMLVLATVCVLLLLLRPYYDVLIDLINTLMNMSGLSGAVFTPILKILGITIISKITSGLAIDSGLSALASVIEIVGVVISIAISTPLINTFLSIIRELI